MEDALSRMVVNVENLSLELIVKKLLKHLVLLPLKDVMIMVRVMKRKDVNAN